MLLHTGPDFILVSWSLDEKLTWSSVFFFCFKWRDECPRAFHFLFMVNKMADKTRKTIRNVMLETKWLCCKLLVQSYKLTILIHEKLIAINVRQPFLLVRISRLLLCCFPLTLSMLFTHEIAPWTFRHPKGFLWTFTVFKSVKIIPCHVHTVVMAIFDYSLEPQNGTKEQGESYLLESMEEMRWSVEILRYLVHLNPRSILWIHKPA